MPYHSNGFVLLGVGIHGKVTDIPLPSNGRCAIPTFSRHVRSRHVTSRHSIQSPLPYLFFATTFYLNSVKLHSEIVYKILKCIVNAPGYIRNSDLHRDLGIETVTDIIAKLPSLMKRDFKTTSTSTGYSYSYSVLLTHLGTFEIVTFIVISESRRLQMSSLSSPSLMKRDFKTTSTTKRPDFST
jgi:hypothetical protein